MIHRGQWNDMKCMICDKEYIALGVHIKSKHKIDLNDYKEEFGIMKTTPLVDEDLSKYLSKVAKDRFMDEDYKEEIAQRMKSDAFTKNKQCPEMSKKGKENLSLRNKERGDRYINSIAKDVKNVLEEFGTMLDVKRKLGTGRETVIKLVSMGKVNYDLDRAKEIRKDRAIIARDNSKHVRVQK